MFIAIRDVMVGDVVCTVKEATVKDTVELMNKYKIGCLIVVENGHAKKRRGS